MVSQNTGTVSALGVSFSHLKLKSGNSTIQATGTLPGSCRFPVPGDPEKPRKMPGIPPDRHGFPENRHGFIVRGMNLRRGMKTGNGAIWTTPGRSGDLPPDDLVPDQIFKRGRDRN
jgi:hypothetical protein